MNYFYQNVYFPLNTLYCLNILCKITIFNNDLKDLVVKNIECEYIQNASFSNVLSNYYASSLQFHFGAHTVANFPVKAQNMIEFHNMLPPGSNLIAPDSLSLLTILI